MPLERTPWVRGYSPVRMDACEGSVVGVGAVACVNTTPRLAS
jgi:hypothetical protein